MSPRRSVLVGMRGAAGLELVLNECQPDFVASSPILLLSEPGSFLDQLGIRHSSPDILHRKTSRIVRFRCGYPITWRSTDADPAARDVGWSLGDLSVRRRPGCCNFAYLDGGTILAGGPTGSRSNQSSTCRSDRCGTPRCRHGLLRALTDRGRAPTTPCLNRPTLWSSSIKPEASQQNPNSAKLRTFLES